MSSGRTPKAGSQRSHANSGTNPSLPSGGRSSSTSAAKKNLGLVIDTPSITANAASSSNFERPRTPSDGKRPRTPSKSGPEGSGSQKPVVDYSANVPSMSELRSLLTDNPESFQVGAFVDKLVKPALDPVPSKGRGSIGSGDFGFDPAALHELFSATLYRLGSLVKEVDERVVAIEEENTKMQPMRRGKIEKNERAVQQVIETIDDIGTHFRKVGLTAVRIGQSLSSTESQRHKAEHAQKLLEYFMAFGTLRYDVMTKDSDSERIEMMSNDKLAALCDENNYVMASEVLSDLTVICEDLNAPHLENAVKTIRVFASRLEKKLLDRFENAAMGDAGAPDIMTMKDCASCLLQFGDPVKVYNTFIYTIVAKQIMAIRRAESVEDADVMRDLLSEFFGLVSSLCQRAFSLIRQVFPASAAPKVTRMLIDRLLNDPIFGIHVKVNQVLQSDTSWGRFYDVAVLQETSMSLADSLDMLTMVHEKTNALAAVLIDYCVESEQPEAGSMGDDDVEAAASSVWPSAGRTSMASPMSPAAGSSRSHQALSSYVKSQFAELFAEQRESYLEKEVSLLRMRLVEILQVAAAGVGLTNTEKKGKRLFDKRGGDGNANELPVLKAEKVDSYDAILQGWLRKEVMNQFLDTCLESISRNASMFRREEERVDNVTELFSVLHNFLATSMLLPTFTAASTLVQQQINNAPPLQFYQVLKEIHRVVASFRDFFKDTVLPEVVSKKTTHTVVVESCRKFLSKIERAGAKTIQRALESIMRQLERIHRETLSKTDYLLKDNLLGELLPTKASLAVREILKQQKSHIVTCMPEKDVKPILSNLAVRVQDMILSRLKQVKINTAGALILQQDVDIMFEIFLSLESPEVREAIDHIKEVVGLFMVLPENLKGLMEHGYLAQQDRVDLWEFIRQRADVRVHGIRAPWVRTLFDDILEDNDDDKAFNQGGSKASPPKTNRQGVGLS